MSLKCPVWVGKILWSRKGQPTPVFSPRESHGQRSLAGYIPWGYKELETAEATWQACMSIYDNHEYNGFDEFCVLIVNYYTWEGHRFAIKIRNESDLGIPCTFRVAIQSVNPAQIMSCEKSQVAPILSNSLLELQQHPFSDLRVFTSAFPFLEMSLRILIINSILLIF